MQDLYFAGLGALAGLIGLIFFFLVMRQSQRARAARRPATDLAILVRDDRVVDSTADAELLLGAGPLVGSDWHRLRGLLAEHFSDLPEKLPAAPLSVEANGAEATAPDGAAIARLDLRPGRDGTTHLSIAAPSIEADLEAQGQWELSRHQRLLSATEEAPFPMWETREDGRLSWGNAAYRRLLETGAADQEAGAAFDMGLPPKSGVRSERVNHADHTGKDHWYEVTSLAREGGAVHFATNIDSLVDAEMAQRKFVQTLTKTFAHLPIGLAVFDRDRRLVLFNPALVDLTRLPADFLTARPNLMSFFDHMRENQTMPEPKNYINWREQLSDVISAARDDRYCETWNLASGLTYKITGRPHPDGAVAFLIEDISAEISLTRRFRSELELTQSVIDCFTDSVAVFSQLGVLAFTNAAYRDFWKCDPDSAFAEMTIVDATKDWQARCEPSPIWNELREFVLTLRDRAAWDTQLVTHSGERLVLSVIPVAAGATMVRFSPQMIDVTPPARPVLTAVDDIRA